MIPRHLRILVSFCAFVTCTSLALQAQSPSDMPAPPALSRHQLALLKAAVAPDLNKAVSLLFQDHEVTGKDVDYEFKGCQFTKIQLGALGSAVVVEWNPLHAPNPNMNNIYILQHGAFHRLLESAGFGPYILSSSLAVPDLAFGGTVGVCSARWYRYHYRKQTGYRIDACNQEVVAKDGKCAITACDAHLPTFPDPYAQQSDQLVP